MVELLKVLLKAVAEEEGVAPKIIATVDELEAIADSDTANVPSLKAGGASCSAKRRWR